MEYQDKRTPNTPWTELLTPDFSPGHPDPGFYRSSQEDDFGYEFNKVSHIRLVFMGL